MNFVFIRNTSLLRLVAYERQEKIKNTDITSNPWKSKKKYAHYHNEGSGRHSTGNDEHTRRVTLTVSTFIHDDGLRPFLYTAYTTGV